MSLWETSYGESEPEGLGKEQSDLGRSGNSRCSKIYESVTLEEPRRQNDRSSMGKEWKTVFYETT